MLKAGTAEIDITPKIGSLIPGQWLRRTSQSVHDPLLVNAVVLESGDTRVALVSADVLSLKNRVVAEARNLILNMAGIPPSHVFLHATHSHTGPPVVDALGTESDPASVTALAAAMAAAVAGADRALKPACLAAWTGQAPNLAFTRRFRMRDGSVQMHPPKGSPEIVEPENEADSTVAGLSLLDQDGRTVALCVNFACHPIVVGGATFYSADYPGGVRRALKRQYGEGTTVLYLNGPCGDVGPDDAQAASERRYGPEWLERIGSGIAGFAVGYASVAEAVEDPGLAAATEQVRLPIRAVPEELVREAEERLSTEDIATPPQDVELIKLREALLLDRERAEQPWVEAEVMALRIGEAVVVGLPGEIFAEFGRQLRAASTLPHTLVAELANGCHGYVPTAQAFDGGGYETWLARSSKLRPEAGDRLVEAAKAALTTVGAA